jgi:hypothetical protein
MGQIELPPLETPSASDGAQEAAAQKLEDATLEPRALVEQTGDIKQAEAIQGSLETLMTSLPNSQAIEGMPPLEMTPASTSQFTQEASAASRQQAIPVEAQLKPVSGSEPGGAGVPPIDLPPQGPGSLDSSNVVSGNLEQAGSRLPPDVATRIGSPSQGVPGETFPPKEDPIGTGKPDTSNIDQTANLDPGGASTEIGMKTPPLAPLDKNGMMETTLGTSQEGAVQTDTAGLQDLQPIPGGGLEGSDGSEWVPPEMYANTNQDGSLSIVGPDGKTLDSPPLITKVVSPDGKEHYLASYPQEGNGSTNFEIYAYSAPLTGMYVHTAQDGSTTVVDANGKPLDSPPTINKLMDPKGNEIYSASYPGSQAILTSYSASLTGLYVHTAQDGTTTVVDANGKPLDSPPTINKLMDPKGNEIYSASYPGSQAILTSYSTPLTGMYVHINQDGSASVVDANGKPLDSPPLIQIISNAKGGTAYLASYPGSQGAALEYYKPPSAKPAPGA